MKNVIQIAGVIDRAEADMLVAAGVNYLGFPLRLSDGREDLTETDARAIISSLDSRCTAVCITYLNRASDIVTLCETLGVSWVQLHAPISLSELVSLRTHRPNLSLIKSLIVRDHLSKSLVNDLHTYSEYVDAFITDTFDPESGRSGATGKTHDWTISRQLVEVSSKPVILAGGLTPHNVREAIQQVRPAGVDSHTGVEGSDGRKDPKLVQAFISEAKDSFRQMKLESLIE